MTDYEISRNAKLIPISEITKRFDILEETLVTKLDIDENGLIKGL